MRRLTTAKPAMPLLAGLLALLAAVAVVACGGGDGSGSDAQELNFKLETKNGSETISAPKTAEAGLTEITYTNDGKDAADLQLIHVLGDHTAKEVIDGLRSGIKGGPLPEWFAAGGGIGLTQPGATDSVSQVLRAGTYYVFNIEGKFNPKTTPVVEVTGTAGGDEVAAADATVEASEYAFKSAKPLPSGSSEILFENLGVQPHHMLASKLTGGGTAKEVEKAFKTGKIRPPLDEQTVQTTAVIEGGESQLVSFDLEPGRYAFYCFITDRQGGRPHALLGMVDEIQVE